MARSLLQAEGINPCIVTQLRRCGMQFGTSYYLFLAVTVCGEGHSDQGVTVILNDGGFSPDRNPQHAVTKVAAMQEVVYSYLRSVSRYGPRLHPPQVMSSRRDNTHAWQTREQTSADGLWVPGAVTFCITGTSGTLGQVALIALQRFHLFYVIAEAQLADRSTK